jgi:hypothetical protein
VIHPLAEIARYLAIQSHTSFAQARILATTGATFPTYVLPTGIRNARATPTHIEMHTGLAPMHVPAVYAHELAHELLGHTTWRKHISTRQKEWEADYFAGKLLTWAMLTGTWAGLGAIGFALAAGGGQHGSGAERAVRMSLGMIDAYYGR